MARVGLVLGAGGVAGHAFHAGVLRALVEITGWDPRAAQVVVGTSAGSHVGALLRAGLSVHDIGARYVGDPLSASGQELLARVGRPTPLPRPSVPRPGMAAPRLLARSLRRPGSVPLVATLAGLLPPGTASLDTFATQIRALFDADWPAGTLWLPAVGLQDGRRVVFGRDEAWSAHVGTAVAASCAVPAWFRPVEVDGVRFVDGGVASPTNADLVAGLGLEVVVVSSPMSVHRRHWKPAADLLTRHAFRWRLGVEATRVRNAGAVVVAVQPTAADVAAMGINAMEPRRRTAVFTQAYRSAMERFSQPHWRERLSLLEP